MRSGVGAGGGLGLGLGCGPVEGFLRNIGRRRRAKGIMRAHIVVDSAENSDIDVKSCNPRAKNNKR